MVRAVERGMRVGRRGFAPETLMYHLQSFGGVALTGGDGSSIRLRSRKHLALLLFLVANGRRVHTRRELASLLWDTPPGRARHSLSQAVYDLRCRLDGIILGFPGEEVQLDSGRIRYDVDELERAVKEGNLGRAVELYRGPFATNLDTTGTDDFERWLETERVRLQRLVHLSLRRYVKECDAHAKWGEMCVAALKLADMDPLDEEAHRALMRGLWLHGDRTSALRHYEEISAFLTSELPGGISSETRQLAERIRHEPAEGATIATSAAENRPPLVGRGQEFEFLKDAVRELRRGRAGTVVVQGEPGIGKSRLIQEFVRSACLEPIRVLESRCYAAEKDVPYGPVVDGLRPIAEQMARTLPNDGCQYTRLGHLFQEFASFMQPEIEHGVDPNAWRRRLYEEVADLVRNASEWAPILWVVEDMHWMDATSRSLLHYLSRRLAERPFMLVMTERVGKTHVAVRAQRRRPPRPGETMDLVLPPLTDSEIGQLVAEALPEAKEHPAVELAQKLAGGNPFYALEVFRAAFASAEWIAEADTWDPLTDARLSDVFDIRFRNLPDGSLRILRAVSVLDRHATPRHVAALASLSLQGAADVSTELYERGLLVDGDSELDFVNDIVREYVYKRMSSMQRAALHLAAAQQLDGEPGIGAATLARHYHLGDDKPNTFKCGMQAATEASSSGGHLEAASMATLALAAAGERDETLRALRILASAELLSAQLKSAQEHYSRILDLDTEMSLEARIETKLHIVETMAELSEWDGGRELLSSLADEIENIPEPTVQLRTRAETLFWSLKIAMRQNDCEAARAIALSARRLRDTAVTEGTVTPVADVSALCCVAAYTAFFENAEDALQLIQLAERRIGLIPDYLIERVRLFSGMVRLRMALWDEGEQDILAAIDLARKRKDLVQLSTLWNNLACCALEQGDWDRFEKTASMAESIQEKLPVQLDVTLPLTINRANSLFYQGHPQAAGKLYKTALDSALGLGSREFVPELMACRGLTALQLGDRATAEKMWNGVKDLDAAKLAGVQERFKLEWFRGYHLRNESSAEAGSRFFKAAEEQEFLDVPSYLKMLWLGCLLFPKLTRESLREADLLERLRAARMWWFSKFAKRWLRATDYHARRLSRFRGARS
ncbi:MAG: AAA family ATPase [Gemmatimonadota bacterium]